MRKLTRQILLTAIFVFFVTQIDCAKRGSDKFEKQLTDLLPNAELRESIVKYLDLVPSSHHSRSHASRILKMKIEKRITITKIITLTKSESSFNSSSSGGGNNTISLAQSTDTYNNRLKPFAAHILEQKPKCKACSKCSAKRPKKCPKPRIFTGGDCKWGVRTCSVLCDPRHPSIRDCRTARGCIIPPLHQCAPKPDCSFCDGRRRSASKSNSTEASGDKEDDEGSNKSTVPPAIMREMPTIAIKDSKRVKTEAKRETKQKGDKRRIKANGSTTAKPMDDSDCPCKKGSSTTTTTTTKPSTTSKSSPSPASQKPNVNSKATKNTETESPDGIKLFDENIELFAKNATALKTIMKVFDEIPRKYGGRDSELAAEILSFFGEYRSEPTTINSRTYVFGRNSRDNFKAIMGHLMDRAVRKRCSCDRCGLYPKCARSNKSHRCVIGGGCPPCPRCMYPYHCPTYVGCPTYKLCPCLGLSPRRRTTTVDKEELLDDVDTENPIKPGELEKSQPCKGFTCAFEKTCGKADLNDLTPKKKQSGYIVGGQTIKYGDYPQFVKLDISLPLPDSDIVGICGGVLISNKHVLTAGHCVQIPVSENKTSKVTADKITVKLGDYKANKKDEHEERRKVESICFSSKWTDPKSEGSRYDYSILTLDKEVEFNDYIQPACLPYNMKESALEKAKCYVVGLGVTNTDNKDQHVYAKKVQSLRLKPASCESWGLKEDDRSRHCFTKFQDSAGDTCSGDSGGPILCPMTQADGSQRWTVTGIVSYGSQECNGEGVTGWVAVYTRVQALLEDMNKDCKI